MCLEVKSLCPPFRKMGIIKPVSDELGISEDLSEPGRKAHPFFSHERVFISVISCRVYMDHLGTKETG